MAVRFRAVQRRPLRCRDRKRNRGRRQPPVVTVTHFSRRKRVWQQLPRGGMESNNRSSSADVSGHVWMTCVVNLQLVFTSSLSLLASLWNWTWKMAAPLGFPHFPSGRVTASVVYTINARIRRRVTSVGLACVQFVWTRLQSMMAPCI